MRYTFICKEIHSQRIFNLFVDSSTTIKEFCTNIQAIICNEFDIEPYNHTVKIIEAGQYNNCNGFAPELANSMDMVYTEDSTFEDIFQHTWKKTAFYAKISKI